LACKEAQRYDEAIACFTEAIQLDPRFEPAYCQRAALYSEKEDSGKAVADLTQAIQISPNESGGGIPPEWKYYMRGSVYYEREENTQAIADFTKAIQLNPEIADSYCGRWFAYAGIRRDNKSQSRFAKVPAN
jgi:tetratricopeptide (TPR) repeat protein